MGFAARSTGRFACFNSADRNGAARLRRSEDCRGAPEAEAELLPREPPLQQLVVHAEGSAASRLGVPGALGEQAHRRARSDRTDPRTDEPAKCARFTNVARLSVEHAEVGALTVHGCERLCSECTASDATRRVCNVSLTTIAPVPAKTRANVPMSSAANFFTLRLLRNALRKRNQSSRESDRAQRVFASCVLRVCR